MAVGLDRAQRVQRRTGKKWGCCPPERTNYAFTSAETEIIDERWPAT